MSTQTRLWHNGKLRHIAEFDAPRLNREVSCVPRISKTVSASDNPQARKSRSRPPAVCTYNESPVYIRAHASAISRGHILHVWTALRVLVMCGLLTCAGQYGALLKSYHLTIMAD